MRARYSSLLTVSVLAVAPFFTASTQANDTGLYGKISFGINQTQDQDFNTGSGALGIIDTELATGFIGIAALGYDYGLFRAEAEVAFRDNDVDTHNAGGTPLADATGVNSSYAFMANGYIDFENTSAFTPYIGAGVGFANVNFDGYGTAAIPGILDDDETLVAYQGIAGIDYALSNAMNFSAEYRYFATDSIDIRTTLGNTETEIDYANHSFLIGIKYRF